MPNSRHQLRYVPYHELGDTPNIIVDGSATDSTLLTLSHWPQNTTPTELKRDTSAEIAFEYLDNPRYHVDVEAVSNNHFDQDGLIAMFALIDPVTAQQHRELLIDTANTGDFSVFRNLDSARVSSVLYALEDPATGFLKSDLNSLSNAERDAAVYQALLRELPEILSDLNRYKEYWESNEKHLIASLELLDDNKVTIVGKPELDLAIVQIPGSLAAEANPKKSLNMDDLCHPCAIYSSTPCNRIVLICNKAIEFRYRYESWVQMFSRKPLLRVSLAGLEEQLNEIEDFSGVWRADSVDKITPALRLDGRRDTSIPTDTFLTRLEEYLLGEPPAWNPYE